MFGIGASELLLVFFVALFVRDTVSCHSLLACALITFKQAAPHTATFRAHARVELSKSAARILCVTSELFDYSVV